MSVNASFSPVDFPALRGAETEDVLRARTSGRAAGYADGLRAAERDITAQETQNAQELAEAINAGQKRVSHAVAVLTAAAEALNRRTIPLIEEAQDALAAAALDLAEAVVGSELSDRDTSAATALRRALSGVDTALVLQLRMNPEDLAALDQTVRAETGVTFIADASLAPGDAVSEFENGYLDARVSTALARARAAIIEVEL